MSAHILYLEPSHTTPNTRTDPPTRTTRGLTRTHTDTQVHTRAPRTHAFHNAILTTLRSHTDTGKHGTHSTSGRTQPSYSHASPSPRDATRGRGLCRSRLRNLVPAAPPSGARCRRSRQRWRWRFFYPETTAAGPGDESVSPRREPDWPLVLAWAPRSPTPPPARRGGWCRAAPGPPRAAASEL